MKIWMLAFHNTFEPIAVVIYIGICIKHRSFVVIYFFITHFTIFTFPRSRYRPALLIQDIHIHIFIGFTSCRFPIDISIIIIDIFCIIVKVCLIHPLMPLHNLPLLITLNFIGIAK